MTSGMMLPLTTADLLASTIVGSVLENMDMERLIAGKLETIPCIVTLGMSADVTQRSDTKWRNGSSRRASRCRAWRK